MAEDDYAAMEQDEDIGPTQYFREGELLVREKKLPHDYRLFRRWRRSKEWENFFREESTTAGQ